MSGMAGERAADRAEAMQVPPDHQHEEGWTGLPDVALPPERVCEVAYDHMRMIRSSHAAIEPSAITAPGCLTRRHPPSRA
ncbi:hypothetical protein ACQPZG_00765 (plasmid) [Streptomyces sp. CA-294286]|uniref:hypothetical protein n=1 Tax=Streptomyces sp. CA-294286 TaxID=3240070 RepID=UPI003D8A99D4